VKRKDASFIESKVA